MEKGTRKTRSQINVLSERKMSPFSPDLKQSTHISQQEIDREGGRGLLKNSHIQHIESC